LGLLFLLAGASVDMFNDLFHLNPEKEKAAETIASIFFDFLKVSDCFLIALFFGSSFK